jgi:hypothetical protein
MPEPEAWVFENPEPGLVSPDRAVLWARLGSAYLGSSQPSSRLGA